MHYTIGCRWLDVNQHSPLLNSFKWWTCARDADLACSDSDEEDKDEDDDNDDNNRSDDDDDDDDDIDGSGVIRLPITSY
ncbi:hypothetical protein CGGC5_v010969 [Colletotrichum fructicola Nara gc5]|uniref:Uncharacterized protein n=1 Tax=Colletotrichum fructicola (strain Nara gc5) TaxID=1213859 RepID=A0A7J6IUU8_COLFN|nr:hypothetical protein CGGC5_v010969 [Colletotrichum fructicola Nara gc5]